MRQARLDPRTIADGVVEIFAAYKLSVPESLDEGPRHAARSAKVVEELAVRFEMLARRQNVTSVALRRQPDSAGEHLRDRELLCDIDVVSLKMVLGFTGRAHVESADEFLLQCESELAERSENVVRDCCKLVGGKAPLKLLVISKSRTYAAGQLATIAAVVSGCNDVFLLARVPHPREWGQPIRADVFIFDNVSQTFRPFAGPVLEEGPTIKTIAAASDSLAHNGSVSERA
jgi:hypothetical protein